RPDPVLAVEAVGEEERDPPVGIQVVDVDPRIPVEPEADGHLVPQVVPALIRLDPNLQLPRFGLDDDPQGEQLILLRLRVPHAQPPPGHHQSEEEEKLQDRKSTRLNSSHVKISYAVFCLKQKK